MRRVFDHAIALSHGFAHQAEFAVFKVADAAMRHVRGSCRCAGAEVGAVDQQYVHTVERQITECACTVDAPAHDEHRGWAIFE